MAPEQFELKSNLNQYPSILWVLASVQIMPFIWNVMLLSFNSLLCHKLSTYSVLAQSKESNGLALCLHRRGLAFLHQSGLDFSYKQLTRQKQTHELSWSGNAGNRNGCSWDPWPHLLSHCFWAAVLAKQLHATVGILIPSVWQRRGQLGNEAAETAQNQLISWKVWLCLQHPQLF